MVAAYLVIFPLTHIFTLKYVDSSGRADSGYDDMSIELSLEEVVKLAGQMGFRMLRNETVQAPYMGELFYKSQSMLTLNFCRKNRIVTDHEVMYAQGIILPG